MLLRCLQVKLEDYKGHLSRRETANSVDSPGPPSLQWSSTVTGSKQSRSSPYNTGVASLRRRGSPFLVGAPEQELQQRSLRVACAGFAQHRFPHPALLLVRATAHASGGVLRTTAAGRSSTPRRPQSTSSHVVSGTSPDHAAVSTRNSTAGASRCRSAHQASTARDRNGCRFAGPWRWRWPRPGTSSIHTRSGLDGKLGDLSGRQAAVGFQREVGVGAGSIRKSSPP